jgi:hypothetical protein
MIQEYKNTPQALPKITPEQKFGLLVKSESIEHDLSFHSFSSEKLKMRIRADLTEYYRKFPDEVLSHETTAVLLDISRLREDFSLLEFMKNGGRYEYELRSLSLKEHLDAIKQALSLYPNVPLTTLIKLT